MRFLAELLGDGGHDLVDFGQGEIGAADDVYQQAVGLAGELGRGKQRAGLEIVERLGDGVGTGADGEAEV
jgi:hypothetical protein